MNKANILVIDDEPPIRRLLQITLESQDYQVHLAASAKEGEILAANHPPDLILLDLGLPDQNGQALLKSLRLWYNKAIVILSANDRESEIVTALDNGASDYLCKPFRTAELLARIRAAIRGNQPHETHQQQQFGDLELDLTSRVVRKSGTILKLTNTEFNLLVLLSQNEGRVLTHSFLLKRIWGLSYQNETQYLRVFISNLRKKIETNPHQPNHIITENGIGYRFQG